MKEVMVALAKYKQAVDQSLLEILEKLGEDKIGAATGTFFPSIYAQLKHVFGADVNYFCRFKPAFPKSSILAKSRFLDYDLEALKILPVSERKRLFADIREMDRDVHVLVSELAPADFSMPVTYKNYQGQTETHELWKLLLHWFNHGTHHRGTISGQLDILGVENDYSGLLQKI